MVSSDRDALKRVVEAFERSDWAEIDVRWGDLRIHLSTSAPGAATAAATTSGATGSTVPAFPATSDRRGSDGAGGPISEGGPSVPTSVSPTSGSAIPALAEAPAGAHLIVSPSPGIFWRSPEPGVPPFADVGVFVDASATVCIVEVMKLMNHVKAGIAGDVVAVYVENGGAVQKGQALFAIAPADPSS